jgi:hypothetical protein
MTSVRTSDASGPISWSRVQRPRLLRVGRLRWGHPNLGIVSGEEGDRRDRPVERWLQWRRKRASGGIRRRSVSGGLGTAGHRAEGWTKMLSLERVSIGIVLVGEVGSVM